MQGELEIAFDNLLRHTLMVIGFGLIFFAAVVSMLAAIRLWLRSRHHDWSHWR